MQERRNFYRILGVQPDAPIGVIRGAYRTLMQKLRKHPDLGGDQRDASAINEAWRVLRDPQLRDEYDRQLLSDYDIRMLASAGRPLRRPVAEIAMTRRNYYRILGVQPNSPQALIDSAYRAICASNPDNRALIVEAYAVLGDPNRRRYYDQNPERPQSCGPEPIAAEPVDAAPVNTGQGTAEHRDSYSPLIRSYCLFCKTPHSPYPKRVVMTRCRECQSPLQRLELDGNLADRSFKRRDLIGAVEFFEYWPSPANHGRLQEFTPDGLRLTARRSLEPGQVVRISAAAFDAVARVVHCTRCDGGFSSGMALMTADFASHGVFIDVKS